MRSTSKYIIPIFRYLPEKLNLSRRLLYCARLLFETFVHLEGILGRGGRPSARNNAKQSKGVPNQVFIF